MIRGVKLVALVGLLACGLSLVGESRGSIYTITDPLTTTYTLTVGSWASYGAVTTGTGDGVQQQDKLWTLVSSSANLDTTTVTFSMFTSGGEDYHILTINGPLGPGTYDLDYSIQINEPPATGFNNVSLGVTLNGTSPSATVTKDLYDADGGLLDTLTSVNGNSVSTSPTSPVNGATFLMVDEEIVVSSGFVYGTTDTYTETLVPEPATLIVWSLLGGIGIALGWRRWKRAA